MHQGNDEQGVSFRVTKGLISSPALTTKRCPNYAYVLSVLVSSALAATLNLTRCGRTWVGSSPPHSGWCGRRNHFLCGFEGVASFLGLILRSIYRARQLQDIGGLGNGGSVAVIQCKRTSANVPTIRRTGGGKHIESNANLRLCLMK